MRLRWAALVALATAGTVAAATMAWSPPEPATDALVPAAAAVATPTVPEDPPGAYQPRITVRQIGTAVAGQPARFEVIEQGFGGPGTSGIDFGEGLPGPSGTGVHGCGGANPAIAPHTEQWTHVYRFPGQWRVRVYFEPDCDDRKLPIIEGFGTITVLPSEQRVPSNGPERPLSEEDPLYCKMATRGWGEPEPLPRTVDCLPDYEDDDGYVTRIAFDWGDGSEPTVFEYPLSDCVDPTTRWPMTQVDDEKSPPWPTRHQYPRPGRYRAYVTVTSTGCDGLDPQTAVASTRVEVE